MRAKSLSSFRRESGLRQRAPEKMPLNGAEWRLPWRLSFVAQFALRANARTLCLVSYESSARSGNARGFRDLLAERAGFEPAVRSRVPRWHSVRKADFALRWSLSRNSPQTALLATASAWTASLRIDCRAAARIGITFVSFMSRMRLMSAASRLRASRFSSR
jgi:hypothetical protein